MTDVGFVWIQVRGFGTKVPAREADQRAAEIMAAFDRPIATVHPTTCAIAPRSGMAAGPCNCEPRWVRRAPAEGAPA